MRSDFTYERLSQGEVSLDLDEKDKEHLKALAVQDEEFLAQHPFTSLPQVRVTRQRPWASMSAVAAVLVIFVGLGTLYPAETRTKGADLSLLVYHKTGTGTELLGSTAQLGQGDEVQLAYLAGTGRYAAILSVDGRGTVTTHLPLHGAEAVQATTSQPELLPYSYKLDDAPEYETVFLITSPTPFEVAQIRPFVKATIDDSAHRLQLPEGFESATFRIAKKEPSE